MASGVSFPGQTHILGPPKGMDDLSVFRLPVLMGRDLDGQPVVLSCWKLTDEERVAVLASGIVWLSLYGTNMQPALITVERPDHIGAPKRDRK